MESAPDFRPFPALSMGGVVRWELYTENGQCIAVREDKGLGPLTLSTICAVRMKYGLRTADCGMSYKTKTVTDRELKTALREMDS